MFAIVESGSITSYPKGNRGIQIGSVKHSADIFTSKWTESERNAIGLYTIEIDETNKKNDAWYTNTDITYAYDSSSNKVKGTYGTATAKAIADTLYTEQNKTDGEIPTGKDVGDVAVEGLKTIKKRLIDNDCAGILAPSDWMYIKAGEEGVSMDSGWKTWRASVRTKCNSMQTQIDNAANVDALAALFDYTVQGDGSFTRPLGEFPIKE
tara:strand:+ start:15 stop:641 length:627 start_codon:yes stop_codon:yes gene_type:complete